MTILAILEKDRAVSSVTGFPGRKENDSWSASSLLEEFMSSSYSRRISSRFRFLSMRRPSRVEPSSFVSCSKPNIGSPAATIGSVTMLFSSEFELPPLLSPFSSLPLPELPPLLLPLPLPELPLLLTPLLPLLPEPDAVAFDCELKSLLRFASEDSETSGSGTLFMSARTSFPSGSRGGGTGNCRSWSSEEGEDKLSCRRACWGCC
mmetsp:Transcript_15808/g.28561  ORF Transcript_15808/g.28561 Transcript_15808/m.28561 type:complete len:206 (+) Transcript_15808:5122-5739(+)